jgi:hypothetical protein
VVPAERSLLSTLRRTRAPWHALLLLLTLSLLVAGVDIADAATSAVAATSVAKVDPNALGKGAADAVTVVRWVSPGTYELDVQNTSGIGYINEFTWVPPASLTVTAIESAQGGKCQLVGGNIQCNGKLPPPNCTCLAGGDLVVTFTATGLEPTFANGYWSYYGMVGAYLQIQQMTPVPYHIPSSKPSGLDLPLCKKGQKSSKSNPCV